MDDTLLSINYNDFYFGTGDAGFLRGII